MQTYTLAALVFTQNPMVHKIFKEYSVIGISSMWSCLLIGHLVTMHSMQDKLTFGHQHLGVI